MAIDNSEQMITSEIIMGACSVLVRTENKQSSKQALRYGISLVLSRCSLGMKRRGKVARVVLGYAIG